MCCPKIGVLAFRQRAPSQLVSAWRRSPRLQLWCVRGPVWRFCTLQRPGSCFNAGRGGGGLTRACRRPGASVVCASTRRGAPTRAATCSFCFGGAKPSFRCVAPLRRSLRACYGCHPRSRNTVRTTSAAFLRCLRGPTPGAANTGGGGRYRVCTRYTSTFPAAFPFAGGKRMTHLQNHTASETCILFGNHHQSKRRIQRSPPHPAELNQQTTVPPSPAATRRTSERNLVGPWL